MASGISSNGANSSCSYAYGSSSSSANIGSDTRDGLFRAGAWFSGTRDGEVHLSYVWGSLPEGTYSKYSLIVIRLYYCAMKPGDIGVARFVNESYEPGAYSIIPDVLGVQHIVELSNVGYCNVGETYIPDTYANYYPLIEFQAWDNTQDDLAVYVSIWLNDTIGDLIGTIYSAPSLTYNQSNNLVTIGRSMTGKRILEFSDVTGDGNAISPTGITDEETLMTFYYASLINMEWRGDYSAYFYSASENKIERWAPGTYYVSMIDTQGADDPYSGKVSTSINSAIGQLNSVLKEFNITLIRKDSFGEGAHIVVTYGNMKSLWNETYTGPSGYIHGGQWTTSCGDDGVINRAKIEIANEAQYYTWFSQVCFEELYECFGCGYDQWDYPCNTTTYELGGPWNPSVMTTKDANLLRLVYSCNAGDDVTAVALKHNIPKGVKLVSESDVDQVYTASLDFLSPKRQYRIRAWIVNWNGDISYTTPWTNITTPALSPWSWERSNGTASDAETQTAYKVLRGTEPANKFSAKVWNDLVDKVVKVRAAKGRQWTTQSLETGKGYLSAAQCKVTSESYLRAAVYNSVKFNIGSLKSTGIQDVSADTEELTGNKIYHLTEVLNELIAEL